ncbi:MAG: beta-propeller domain-containing protein, methanol dehydrogenase [Leptolyngbya sp.]|nr:MAG: beta-propeller domain-containing protein, methanol dehydrogenase [Leptolyngbya sp.]
MSRFLTPFSLLIPAKNPLLQAFQRFCLSVLLVLFVTQLIALPASATSLYEIPDLPENTWVLDTAEILSRTTEGKLSTAFSEVAAQSGLETRVVTIHRLDYEETIEGFTDKLFKRWFPTDTEQANQTLLVLDNVTNNTGIRTGERVKQLMPDAIATSVAQETVLIPLKEGNKYNQAFLGAGDRLVAVLSGQTDPGPPEVKDTVMVEGTFATPEKTKESNAMVWVFGFLIAATIIPMATYYFYQYMGSR